MDNRRIHIIEGQKIDSITINKERVYVKLIWKDHKPKTFWKKEVKAGYYYYENSDNPLNLEDYTLDNGYIIRENVIFYATQVTIRLRGNRDWIVKSYPDHDACVVEMTEIARTNMASVVII